MDGILRFNSVKRFRNKFFPLFNITGGIYNSSAMASPEDVIEPEAQSSSAQNLARRRFSRDLHNLTPDELDGLVSSSGKKKKFSFNITLNMRYEPQKKLRNFS